MARKLKADADKLEPTQDLYLNKYARIALQAFQALEPTQDLYLNQIDLSRYASAEARTDTRFVFKQFLYP